MSDTVTIELEDGTRASAVAFDGSVLEIRCPRALAPGAPVQLRARIGERALALRGKTLAPKRRGEGEFAIRLRLLNLRREEREALHAALSATR